MFVVFFWPLLSGLRLGFKFFLRFGIGPGSEASPSLVLARVIGLNMCCVFTGFTIPYSHRVQRSSNAQLRWDHSQ